MYFLKHIFKSYVLIQCETAAQQEFAEELQKREHFLAEREELLFRHETALSKMKGVEEEVLIRFQIMKEVTVAFDFRVSLFPLNLNPLVISICHRGFIFSSQPLSHTHIFFFPGWFISNLQKS